MAQSIVCRTYFTQLVPRSIHVVANGCSPCLGQSVPLCPCARSSNADAGFHVSTTVNAAAVDIGVHVSL